ncbi:MAG: TrkH family potassium uptake protein [Chlamydiota bacterium]|nr:TrkH family potassium uptake protein [Chlamydiota bacterium]
MVILYRDICKLLGYYFFGLTATLCIPFILATYYEYVAAPEIHPQPHSTIAFLGAILVCLLAGGICYSIGKKSTGNFYRREGIFVVVLIWFLSPAVAALPYSFSQTLTNPFQAYFEGASGLTTTGSTTLTAKKFDDKTGKEIPIKKVVPGVHDTVYSFYGTVNPVRDPETGEVLYEGIEAVSKAILFWRSFTQWLGGMGIIVLFVAVLPALGVGGKQLFHAEMPGPVKDSLTPRIKETASQLWKIYLGISALEIIILLVTNSEISFLDAFTITFSTVSTGGFCIKNTSIGAFASSTTDWVIMIFMFISSINFSLYFYAIRGKIFRLYDRELIIYIALLLTACGLTSYFIAGTEKLLLNNSQAGVFTNEEAVRYGFFQIISAQTTTGFTNIDYDIWPYTAQVILIIVMFFGGMAGSTSGGMKIMRVYMLFRIAQDKIESSFRPESIRTFRIGNSDVDSGASIRVLCFFLILVSIATLATFLFMMDGLDPETAFATTACMINNIGIGFRMTGPTESCAFMTNEALSLSSFLMILGRLEFFAILAVLVPAFWKQHS